MALFAVYRKSKRAKDLVLVAWPVDAPNAADAVVAARDALKDTNDPGIHRLRAYGPFPDNATPSQRIDHRHYTNPDNRRRMGGL